MGIDSNIAYEIARSSKSWGLEGAVCSLGVVGSQTSTDELDVAIRSAGVVPATTAKNPFLRLGFQVVESMDVSPYEGCTHIFDLNDKVLPSILTNRFDVVYNAGTLEHIFDVRCALRNIFNMLRVGGVIIDVAPVNGWVDHGFYQFSPTFFTDFYLENRFEILEARLLEYEAVERGVTVHPYVPGALDGRAQNSFTENLLYFGVARKVANSTCEHIPLQHRYAELHRGESMSSSSLLQYFLPYRIINGEPQEIPLIKSRLTSWRRGEGYELLAHLPELAHLSGNVDGQWSPLILMEDERVIGPPALHERIRNVGKGAYSHWGEWLHFSTSDNLEPGSRIYECAIPADQFRTGNGNSSILEKFSPLSHRLFNAFRSLTKK